MKLTLTTSYKLIITTIMVVSFAFLPKYGFVPFGREGFDLKCTLLFNFCHANIYHLLANILGLWLIKGKLHLPMALTISLTASLLPEFIIPIYGCSGTLFAIVGIKYGLYGNLNYMLKKTWWVLLIPLFIPNIAGLFHIYCILLGFMYGWCKGTYCLWLRMR